MSTEPTPTKPPRVMLHEGHNTWRILKPTVNYGKELEYREGEDRRYHEECVVKGDLYTATEVLHRLERYDG